jgi:hypothetical protein
VSWTAHTPVVPVACEFTCDCDEPDDSPEALILDAELDVEAVKEDLKEAEKHLADLKAEKAKADAEKAKTVGRKVAEATVRVRENFVEIGESHHPDGRWVVSENGRPPADVSDRIRNVFAAAIDKAVQDAVNAKLTDCAEEMYRRTRKIEEPYGSITSLREFNTLRDAAEYLKAQIKS